MNERTTEPSYLVFRATPHARPAKVILPKNETRFSIEFWRPSLLRVRPSSFALYPFALWWIAHHTRVFKSEDYSIIVITEGTKLVHRSCIFPLFFRFPFMKPTDLQVGDTWTAPEARGQGLGAWALTTVLAQYPARTIWYITASTNLASIRVAHSAGLSQVATARRYPRAGLSILGYYKLESESSNVEP